MNRMPLIHPNLRSRDSVVGRRETQARAIISMTTHARHRSLNLAGWVLLCLFIASGEGQAASWVGFEPPMRFEMGAPVVSFSSANSANGRVLVVGTNGRGATAFLRFERGTFQLRRDIPGGFVVSLAMANLNADDTPDLVVPDYFGEASPSTWVPPTAAFVPVRPTRSKGTARGSARAISTRMEESTSSPRATGRASP